jgi:predicted flap endonuclease-1-like 5' DNA nuclease
MFKEWGFLLTEIWFLLAMAGVIGLIAGWIIWGQGNEVNASAAADTGEADRLRADLAACRARGDGLAAKVAELEAQLAARPVAAAAPAAALMGGAAAVRPAALAGPRDGRADDLKLIKGVGPKLEALCNKLGFWHFDQIANWTPAEVAWVDDNLEGFKGRVSRENWIAQARDLAAGLPPVPGGEK